MNSNLVSVLLCTLLATSQLAGCQSSTTTEVAPLRAVKLASVGDDGVPQSEFIAIVRHEKRAELSFETEGRLTSVAVEVGDQVRRDQIIASLDAEPARLRVQQAEARVRAFQAALKEKRESLRQQQAMFDDGAISETTLNAVKAAFDSADADHHAAIAEQKLAQRALQQVAIHAPFDGTVTARLLQPGAIVAPGQAVIGVEGNGQLQAVAALPPNAIGASFAKGAEVEARTDDNMSDIRKIELLTIAQQLDAGGTRQAIFELPAVWSHLRSGQTITINMDAAPTSVIRLPLTAIQPSTQGDVAHVFIYHPKREMVERRQVKLGAQEGERVTVVKGVSVGEKVVVTGAEFLTNMQKVAVYQPESALTKEFK